MLSVIAPCYNEEDNVEPLAARMTAVFDTMGIEAQLLLVDDCSKDDTWQVIQQVSEREPRVRGVQHSRNQGMVGGWRSGLQAADGDLVCLIDADLQNRPEDVARLYEAYQEHRPDIVQAVRHPAGDPTRKFFSRALNLILNTTFQMRLRDNKSGFILCHRDVLTTLLEHHYDYRFFQSFLGAAAGVRNYTIHEIDTTFERRQAGESFLADVPIRVSMLIGVELLKYRYETLAHEPRRANPERDASDRDASGRAASERDQGSK